MARSESVACDVAKFIGRESQLIYYYYSRASLIERSHSKQDDTLGHWGHLSFVRIFERSRFAFDKVLYGAVLPGH